MQINGKMGEEVNEGSPLTSSVLYSLHVSDGFGYVFRRCFDESVPPGQNSGVESDESKVVFPVEVIQDGLQSCAGLCERHDEMSCCVWPFSRSGSHRVENISPAPSSGHSSSRSGRSQRPHSLGPWADGVAQRSAQSSRWQSGKGKGLENCTQLVTPSSVGSPSPAALTAVYSWSVRGWPAPCCGAAAAEVLVCCSVDVWTGCHCRPPPFHCCTGWSQL